MARPERNSVDYFPFMCEEGNKMFYLEETYGNDGFATFVKLLRELARTEYHYLNLSKPSTLMYLSAKCKVTKEVLESIINDLVDLGKFDEKLWKESKVVWCADFIDSIQDAYKKRNNKCITYDGLLTLLTSLGIRKPAKLPTTASVNPQSKVEYSKEKESKVKERKLQFASTLEPHVAFYGRPMIKEFYNYWTELNKSETKFKQELEKTWSLERRLETWAKNDKNFSNGKQTNYAGAGTGQGYKAASVDTSELIQELTDDIANGNIPGQY